MNDREHALIADCLSGRVDAFGELIRPYQDRLFNTLFRLLGSRDDAAEVLQDALIRAFRNLKTFQGDAALYTWLYRIVVNAAFSSQRRQRLRVVSTEELSNTETSELADYDHRNEPLVALESKERQEIVQDLLAELPDNYRTILVLKDIEGLKYEQIAEILDIPVGTVRSRLHRARSEMRDRLKPAFDLGLL